MSEQNGDQQPQKPDLPEEDQAEVDFFTKIDEFLEGVGPGDAKFTAFCDQFASYVEHIALEEAKRTGDTDVRDQANSALGGIRLQELNHRLIPGYSAAKAELAKLFYRGGEEEVRKTEELRILMEMDHNPEVPELIPIGASLHVAQKLNKRIQSIVNPETQSPQAPVVPSPTSDSGQ